MCVEGLAPGMTYGISGSRDRTASTPTAGGEEVNRAVARFPVEDADLCPVEIDVLLSEGQDLVPTIAREHQQADRRRRVG